MKRTQLWGIFLPWLLLIRPCIHIGNILDSINTIQTNQLSMAYYPEVSVIFQYLTPIIAYHILVNQTKIERPAAKYYITGTDKYSKYLINELSVYCNIQGLNVSIGSYFILISWTTWGLQKNISIVGNIKYDWKGIPKDLKLVADWEERSVMHAYNTKVNIMLVS